MFSRDSQRNFRGCAMSAALPLFGALKLVQALLGGWWRR